MLQEQLHIAPRFLRSIRIDTDIGSKETLNGFVSPESSNHVLLTMARHLQETKQSAFTWTGPYGSGKSSLAAAFITLLSNQNVDREQTNAVFGERVSNTLRTAFPPQRKGWRVLPVVGRRDSPVRVLGDAVKQSGLVSRKPRGGWNDENLVSTLLRVANTKPNDYGGLVLFIDEMGKFLESAAHDDTDVFVFQELAEAASRSKGRLILVGVLHQAFDDYAQRLPQETRFEWQKIQGRFIDLVVDASKDEQIQLVSKAIQNTCEKETDSFFEDAVSSVTNNKVINGASTLRTALRGSWPLHPIVTCLLGPISKRRFGQNQRSVFGFLNSAEPFGFQDFITKAEDNDLYTPDCLWDYLRANLEPSILASPDGHRWAQAVEVVERCEATVEDELHLKLLKSIAVIDLFKDRSGFTAKESVLQTCVPGYSPDQISNALSNLSSKWSYAIFKKFEGAYAIFAGSDFDIEKAVTEAREEQGEIDFKRLNEIAGLQPLLAKRHYHETGTMRWFGINVVPVCSLIDFVGSWTPSQGAIGQFLLAIPTKGESKEVTRQICQEATQTNIEADWEIVIGQSTRSWVISPRATDIFALERVRTTSSELAGDDVARREIDARLEQLKAQLANDFQVALNNSEWYHEVPQETENQSCDLNQIASDLADSRFPDSPHLNSELLNQHKPSGSAIGAQNALLKRMIRYEGDERLGLEGYPAEMGLFSNLLLKTGIYSFSHDCWKFQSPTTTLSDPAGLQPLWEVTTSRLERHSDRIVTIPEIMGIWRQPPFGLKEGLMPTLIVSYFLTHRANLALYREGVFRPEITDIDIETLTKNPEFIGLRWVDLNIEASRLLSGLASVVQDLNHHASQVDPKPIDVARALIATYDDLPNWTKQTIRLSENALKLRNLFRDARDPNKVLFDDIPQIFGNPSAGSARSIETIVQGVKTAFVELTDAYPSALDRLRDQMLAELRVSNTSDSSLKQLRKRAKNIRQLSGDFRMENFISRVSEFNNTVNNFEGIASLAANKPPNRWIDLDFDRTGLELAEFARKFVRLEAFAHIKGKDDKSHSMAIVLNQKDTNPVFAEFDLSDSQRPDLEKLKHELQEKLPIPDSDQSSLVLATLVELAVEYTQARELPHPKQKKPS